jgi:hypothetical protein
MIITLEKRYEFGNGTMTSYYGLFRHTKRYDNGLLSTGELIERFNRKAEGMKYCHKNNITLETV